MDVVWNNETFSYAETAVVLQIRPSEKLPGSMSCASLDGIGPQFEALLDNRGPPVTLLIDDPDGLEDLALFGSDGRGGIEELWTASSAELALEYLDGSVSVIGSGTGVGARVEYTEVAIEFRGALLVRCFAAEGSGSDVFYEDEAFSSAECAPFAGYDYRIAWDL